jgi:glutamine synthetase
VLLHEKPYAGINGSGKHNNWSLSTNTGVNLLSPGNTPKTNLRFLTFFVNTIKAVHDHADLLRATIASAGNDHRLGANEAPPAIISIFIGSQLTRILGDLEKRVKDKGMSPDEKTELKLNIGKIPEIMLDNTDRNRTSPFAFTGNKFEFRAVGSTANCSGPMTALNTIMAKQLITFKSQVDALIDSGIKKDEAILRILREYIIDSRNILFEGNGYGEEWVKEAKKRGLSNIKTTPHALSAYLHKDIVEMFESAGVLTHEELEARNEIYLENYKLKIQIESRVAGDLASNHIIPAALEYQRKLVETVRGLKEIYSAKEFETLSAPHRDLIGKVSNHVSKLQMEIHNMIEERKKANNMSDSLKSSSHYCDKVIPYLESIRTEVDKLELIVDDELWPIPKYRELLFTR